MIPRLLNTSYKERRRKQGWDWNIVLSWKRCLGRFRSSRWYHPDQKNEIYNLRLVPEPPELEKSWKYRKYIKKRLVEIRISGISLKFSIPPPFIKIGLDLHSPSSRLSILTRDALFEKKVPGAWFPQKIGNRGVSCWCWWAHNYEKKKKYVKSM